MRCPPPDGIPECSPPKLLLLSTQVMTPTVEDDKSLALVFLSFLFLSLCLSLSFLVLYLVFMVFVERSRFSQWSEDWRSSCHPHLPVRGERPSLRPPRRLAALPFLLAPEGTCPVDPLATTFSVGGNTQTRLSV